jgi:hypothetical protein
VCGGAGEMAGARLGGAHRIRMQLMTQLQAQVPHPLANDLPYPLFRKRYDYTNDLGPVQ